MKLSQGGLFFKVTASVDTKRSMRGDSEDGVDFHVRDFGEIHREFARFRRSKDWSPMGRCLWWRTDCGKPIGSHSLSKCWLREIAPTGNAIVLRLNAEEVGKKPIQIVDRVEGINQVSVFKGFCSQHDNDLFEPIDRLDFLSSADNCSRVTYRSVCHAAASKSPAGRAQFQTPGIFRSDVPTEFDALAVNMLRQCIELLAFKGEYERWFDGGGKGPINHYAMEVEPRLPFCGTVTFLPYITATGKRLEPAEGWMSMVVLPRKNGSLVIFAVDRQHPKSGDLVVKSWKTIPVAWFADVLLKFMLEHGENLAFSPNWWESLRDGQRADVRRRSFRDIRFGSDESLVDLFRCSGKPTISCTRIEWVAVQ